MVRLFIRGVLASCTSLVALLLFISPAAADTVGMIQLPVLGPDGVIVANGVPGTLLDADGNYVDYTTTVSDVGMLNYYSVAEGDYTIQIRPAQAYDCQACALYQNQDVTFTASLASAETDGVIGTKQTLDTITLTQATRYITVNVVDQDGAVVEGIYISGWVPDGSTYAYGTTNSSGAYSFAVDDADTSTWSVGAYSSDGSYSSDYEYDVTVSSTGETVINLSVIAPDATISVALEDQAGTAVTLAEGAYGSVYCYDINASAERYFYTSISAGQSSANVGVLGGYTYTCNAWLQDYGSAQQEVVIVAGETVAVTIEMLEHTADVTFRYLDADGNVITGLTSMSAYASSLRDAAGADYYGDYAYAADTGSGEILMQIADGITYQVGGWFQQSSTETSATAGIVTAANGSQYIQTYTMTEVTGDATTPQVVEQTLQEADATINVTVLSPEGDPETAAWVSAVEETDDHSAWGDYIGGSTDHNGELSLAATGGKTYRVYAYPTSSYTAGSDILPPTSQLVELAVGQTADISMQSLASDWTLAIEATYPSTTTVSDDTVSAYTYCYAYSADLAIDTYTGLDANHTGQLNLISGGDWKIGCMGYQDNIFYRSADITYTPSTTATVDDTLELEMSDYGDYYAAQTYSFSATSATTLTLPDGVSTLVVPANAIDTTGNVSITVETATDYSVSDNSYPVLAYQFTALNSSGVEVTEFASNLTLNLAYDETKLAELGITETDLLGANFDSETNSWGAPVSTSIDTEANTIQIVLSHFSAYGAVGDRAVAATADHPTKPRSLDVIKRKRTSTKLTWRTPREGTVSKYKVQVRPDGVKKQRHWEKYNNVQNRYKRVTALTPATRYQFRVKACNTSGCSEFTKWSNFRTKP